MVTAVILAAGESTRFGSPKQLALFEGRTLLTRMVDAAVRAKTESVFVVVGAHGSKIAQELKRWPSVHVLLNDDWSEGKASSIRLASKAVSDMLPAATGILLMTCDQPHADAAVLNRLIEKHRQDTGLVVACEYSGKIGVPMLIPRDFFKELAELSGEQGGRVLAEAHPDRVFRVPFPSGAVDIDTVGDLIDLVSEERSETGKER